MSNFNIGQHRADYAQQQSTALDAIERARRGNLPRIFDKTILAPSPGFFSAHAQAIVGSLNETASSVAELVGEYVPDFLEPIARMIENLLLELLESIPIVAEFIAAIGESIIGDAIAMLSEAAPYLGVAMNGLHTVRAIVATGKSARDRVVVAWNKKSFHAETAMAAIKAFEDLINRELASNSIDAMRYGLATGAGVAGILADAGTFGAPAVSTIVTGAVGVANAVVGLVKSITLAALEFMEMVRGNRMLRHPETMTPDCFAKCPTLACYYLVLADTSDLAAFSLSNMGNQNWMTEVEKLAKSCDKVRRKAEKAITKGRFILLNRREGIPLPMRTRVDYRTRSKKLRDKIHARILRPFMGNNVSGDAHRDLEMLKGKLVFEGKKAVDPIKVMVQSRITNFKKKVTSALPWR